MDNRSAVYESKDDVYRGAALLDDLVSGWFMIVDINLLDMQSCEKCVLAQIFGEFNTGIITVKQLIGSHSSYSYQRIAYHCGFDLPSEYDYHFDVLTEQWRDEIKRRDHCVTLTN